MVVIPKGSFLMGSTKNEPGRLDFEGPVHRVTISKKFAVGRFEVTFSQWDACDDWHGRGISNYADDVNKMIMLDKGIRELFEVNQGIIGLLLDEGDPDKPKMIGLKQ